MSSPNDLPRWDEIPKWLARQDHIIKKVGKDIDEDTKGGSNPGASLARRTKLHALLSYYAGWVHCIGVEYRLHSRAGYPYQKPGPDREAYDREVSYRIDEIERGWQFAHQALLAFDRLPARLRRANTEAQKTQNLAPDKRRPFASMQPPEGVYELPLFQDLAAIEQTLFGMIERFDEASLESQKISPEAAADDYLWHACCAAIYRDPKDQWRSALRAVGFVYARTSIICPYGSITGDINWLQERIEDHQ